MTRLSDSVSFGQDVILPPGNVIRVKDKNNNHFILSGDAQTRKYKILAISNGGSFLESRSK